MSEEVMDGDLEFANTEARIRQERWIKPKRCSGRTKPYANDWRIDNLDAVRKQFVGLRALSTG